MDESHLKENLSLNLLKTQFQAELNIPKMGSQINMNKLASIL